MGSYIAHLKIQEVEPNNNRPDGYKVNFVLVDIKTLKPVLLAGREFKRVSIFTFSVYPNLAGYFGDVLGAFRCSAVRVAVFLWDISAPEMAPRLGRREISHFFCKALPRRMVG